MLARGGTIHLVLPWPAEEFVALRSTFGTDNRRLAHLSEEARGELLARLTERMNALDPEMFVYNTEVIAAAAS